MFSEAEPSGETHFVHSSSATQEQLAFYINDSRVPPEGQDSPLCFYCSCVCKGMHIGTGVSSWVGSPVHLPLCFFLPHICSALDPRGVATTADHSSSFAADAHIHKAVMDQTNVNDHSSVCMEKNGGLLRIKPARFAMTSVRLTEAKM